MAVPRDDATFGQRLKALEQELARLKLQASQTVAPTQPAAVMASSTWIDSSANNAPYYYDGTSWIPVRDGNIAVAQVAADTAQGAANAAQATANTALAATTDTLPPASSPAAEVIGGIGALFIRWPTVTNANPVTYKVYVDTTTGFTPGAGNLVGQTAGTSLTVRTLTAGTALTYGTTYFAKIIASDADGSAAAGTEGSGSMMQVNSPDIAANAIVAGKIAAGTIVAADIATDTITANQIATGAITATEIAAGTITATEIASGAITAAKLDAAAITGKTITGGLFRTAVSGQRIEIDSATLNQINFYSGIAGEVASGRIVGGELPSTPGTGRLDFFSPSFTGSASASLSLTNFASGSSNSQLTARNIQTTATNQNQMQAGSHTVQLDSAGAFTLNSVGIARLPQALTAACSTNVDLTTTEVDITGATVTFTTLRANATYMCIGSFYFAMTATNANVAAGKLSVDGTVQTTFANFTGIFTGGPDRVNASQTWIGTLASAGSHTLKLRGVTIGGTAPSAGFRVNATSSTITVLVFE